MKKNKRFFLTVYTWNSSFTEENLALQMANYSVSIAHLANQQFVTLYSREMYSQYTYFLIYIYILNKYYI